MGVVVRAPCLQPGMLRHTTIQGCRLHQCARITVCSRAASSNTTAPAPAATAHQTLQPAAAAALVDRLQTFIFDCDGVLWTGSKVVPGAVETLQYLRSLNKRLLFVTNNSSKSRAEYVSKLAALGIAVDQKEIVASSYAAAAFLRSQGFSSTLHPGKRALVFGSPGLQQELAAAGIPLLPGAQLQLPPMTDPAAMMAVELDPSIGCVVLGWDPSFDFTRLQYAAMCLRELPGCFLVATNLDDRDLIGPRRIMVGTGALVAALEAGSGTTAVNVGKGGPWLFPYLLSRYGLAPEETCIIGDRLDTDIAMGREGGLVTLLPLTGVTTLEDLRTAAATAAAGTNTEASAHAARGKAANTGAKGPVAVLPDHVIASVADLLPQP